MIFPPNDLLGNPTARTWQFQLKGLKNLKSLLPIKGIPPTPIATPAPAHLLGDTRELGGALSFQKRSYQELRTDRFL